MSVFSSATQFTYILPRDQRLKLIVFVGPVSSI